MTNENLPALSRPPKPNWLRASVKGIPYLGDSLDELYYGRLDEARWNRVEQTLAELGAAMRARTIPSQETVKEEFRNLLEDVVPHIARASNETKRKMLRDLLINSVTLASGDVHWESARLAGEILNSLDYAALEILAALTKLGAREGGPKTNVVTPVDAPASVELRDSPDQSVQLSYNRFVVDQGYKQLTDTRARLVVVGAHGRDRYEQVTLTALGEFVIDWCTTKDVS